MLNLKTFCTTLLISRKLSISIIITLLVIFSYSKKETPQDNPIRTFDTTKDLISLHYDHAPDKDDGQSAAADRTLLQVHYGMDWISKHVIAVSGTYGKNGELLYILGLGEMEFDKFRKRYLDNDGSDIPHRSHAGEHQ